MIKSEKLLFDKRVIEGLSKAALHYKLRGDNSRACGYLDLVREIQDLKIERIK